MLGVAALRPREGDKLDRGDRIENN